LLLAPLGLRRASDFDPRQHYVQSSAGVQPPGARNSEPLWVLSQSIYVSKWVDLAHVPAAKREDSIRLAAAGWTPFDETGHYVVWFMKGALLCAWDQAVVSQAQAGAGYSGEKTIPEAALIDTTGGSSANGIRFGAVQGLAGVSLRAVNGDAIVLEQFVGQTLGDVAWRMFQRAAGAAPGDDAPSLAPAKWRREPAGNSLATPTGGVSPLEVRWVFAGALLLALPTIWYANQALQYANAARDARQRAASTEQELNATLTARRGALQTVERAEQLHQLLSRPNHIALFARVNDVISQLGKSATFQVVEWDIREDQLRFVLLATGEAPQATTLVSGFEKVTGFADVGATIDGNRATVKLRLAPTTLPAATNSPAASTNPSPSAKPLAVSKINQGRGSDAS
jgi:hypothetical protein